MKEEQSEREETRRNLNDSSKDLSFFNTLEAHKVLYSPHQQRRGLTQAGLEESKALHLTECVPIEKIALNHPETNEKRFFLNNEFTEVREQKLLHHTFTQAKTLQSALKSKDKNKMTKTVR